MESRSFREIREDDEYGKVHILIISHKYGEEVRAFYREEDANKALADYVAENWRDMMPRDRECPKDHDEMVEVYFDIAWQQESYLLEYRAIE